MSQAVAIPTATDDGPHTLGHNIIHITRHSRLHSLLQERLLARGQGLVVVWKELPDSARWRDWAHAIECRSQEAGCPLAFVCPRKSLRRQLRSLSIPVFASVASASRFLSTRQGHKRRPRNLGPRARKQMLHRTAPHPALPRRPGMKGWQRGLHMAMILVVLAAVLTVFAQFVYPSATITIYPAVDHLHVEIPMSASLRTDTPDSEAGLVPLRYVSVAHEIVRTGSTSGERLVPTDKAQGILSVTNIAGEPVVVPAGTIVQTGTGQAHRFVTTEEKTLPATPVLRTLIPIEAAVPGETGNVPANSINTVAGNLAFQIRATNPDPTTGGVSAFQAVMAQDDQDRLRAQLLADAQRHAYDILARELQAREWLPPETLQVDVQWTSSDFFNDETTENFTMTMMVLISGMALNTGDLVEHVMAQIARHVPAGARLFPDTLDIALQPAPIVAGTDMDFIVTASATHTREEDLQHIRTQLQGRTPGEAEILLETWSPFSRPEIRLHPARRDTLPRLSHRIRIHAEYRAEAA